MKKILFLVIIVLLSVSAFAQNRQQIRPDWLLKKPEAGNDTYEYVIEHGVGLTEKDALDEAINRVHQYYIHRLGQKIESSQEGVTAQTETYAIPFKKVCEYTEKDKDGTFTVYVLCQVAVRGNVTPVFDEYYSCNSIGEYKNFMHKKNVSAIVASIFMPGAGQMVKRHYGSGVLTLLGEVVFVGGAVGSYFYAQNQLSIMRNYDVSLTDFNAAKKNYGICRIANIACLSAAGALYVYSLIRTGTMKYKFKNDHLSFAPVLIPTEQGLASGACLTFKF